MTVSTSQLTGGMSFHVDTDYDGFCQSVRVQTGLDLSAYKRGQMERRLRAMADRVGAKTLREYWNLISKDQTAMRGFLDRVTINVSEFFRNPDKFEELRRYIIPELLQDKRSLFIWSAGCSIGAEAYSLKILLHQLTPGVNHRIWATDIDNDSLARARQGIYCSDDLKNVDERLRRQYFTDVDAGVQVVPSIRQGIEYQRHDLLRDSFPEKVDLILCRNVVIYFSDETKNRLFDRFYQALRPGGYLLVGSTERIFTAQAIGYSSPRPFFYQRPV
ncbi:MAG: CheR family methyltransferase [Armatimonadota bacterium]